jgi:[protein-PII] uridylyltransferase
MTGRAEERLSFDLQRPMAERLGYRDRHGLLAVERFMKHYFLIAKDVGDLTTILCSALEIEQVKSTPTSFAARLNPMTWSLRRKVRTRTEFKVENGRLNVADDNVFKRDPVNLIRFFAVAEETGTFFHPSAIRLLRASHNLIDDTLRADVEANRIFLALLTSKSNPEATLRRMNEAGVLGRFMPEFGKVVSMMQFNMYHHYTVDEHLVRTVGELARIEAGAVVEQLPLSSEIISTIQNRRALYVAALLHDIGKGRVEDHSILGARMAREICPRLGLPREEVELVVWLIEQHLTMSTIAQSRDLSDPKTIRMFADIVQSPERLKLLLLLTVADIRDVGPQTWNGWKGQLLRTLYYETEPLVGGGHVIIGAKERAQRAADAFKKAAANHRDIDADAFIARHYPDYWLKTDLKKQLEHARFLTELAKSDRTLATRATTDAFTSITELTVFAPDHPRLLARFAGACAAAGANIVGAHISTTRDGSALDTFLLQRDMPLDDDETRRAQRIGESIERILEGKARVETMIMQRRSNRASNASFDVVPEVVIDNALSDRFTVLEVAGLDRTGLLYDLTSAISDLNLDIASAHITTFGEKAVDVFYVTDLTNKKITSETRQKAIRDRLKSVLQPPALVT